MNDGFCRCMAELGILLLLGEKPFVSDLTS